MNAAASSNTPSRLQGVEHLTELVRTIREGSGADALMWKCDHASAYKQLPIRPADANVCVIVCQNRSGAWMCFKPRTVLFGSNVAVVEYNAVSMFVSYLFCLWFGLPVFPFFDDFCGAGPACLGDLCQKDFILFNTLCGFDIKSEKTCSVWKYLISGLWSRRPAALKCGFLARSGSDTSRK